MLALVLISPLLSRLLAMAVSRRREYLADATAVERTRNPEGLAQVLEKIAASAYAVDTDAAAPPELSAGPWASAPWVALRMLLHLLLRV